MTFIFFFVFLSSFKFPPKYPRTIEKAKGDVIQPKTGLIEAVGVIATKGCIHAVIHRYDNERAVRIFLLTAHYRSVLDYNEKALFDASLNTQRFFDALSKLELANVNNKKPQISRKELEDIHKNCENALLDDFNTPKFISELTNIGIAVTSKINVNHGYSYILSLVVLKMGTRR